MYYVFWIPWKKKHLNEQIQKFCDLDFIAVQDDVVSIYEKHNKGVEWKGGFYEAGSPLKENYPAIKHNYNKCCKRLWSSRKKLDKKHEHLKLCHDIINNQLEKGIVAFVSNENQIIEKVK